MRSGEQVIEAECPAELRPWVEALLARHQGIQLVWLIGPRAAGKPGLWHVVVADESGQTEKGDRLIAAVRADEELRRLAPGELVLHSDVDEDFRSDAFDALEDEGVIGLVHGLPD
jgi:hypothetical protein